MRIWRSRRGSLIAFVVLLVGTVTIGRNLAQRNAEHRKPDKYTYAFPDLQNAALAHDAGKAKTILTKWNDTGANKAIRGAMQTDLVFPLFYAPLAALLAYRASIRRPTPWVAGLGRWSAVAALIGGLADLAENATMLTMLGDPGAASSVSLVYVFSWIKSAGPVLAVFYVPFSHLDS